MHICPFIQIIYPRRYVQQRLLIYYIFILTVLDNNEGKHTCLLQSMLVYMQGYINYIVYSGGGYLSCMDG